MELNQIPQNPNNWGNVADLLNENSGKIEAETAKLNNVTTKFKGYFTTSTALSAKWPSPLVGDTAWVGATYPGVVYRCNVPGEWLATADVPPSNTVNLSEYATQDAVSNEFASVRSDLNEIENLFKADGCVNLIELVSDSNNCLSLTENSITSIALDTRSEALLNYRIKLYAGKYNFSYDSLSSSNFYIQLHDPIIKETINVFPSSHTNANKVSFNVVKDGNYTIKLVGGSGAYPFTIKNFNIHKSQEKAYIIPTFSENYTDDESINIAIRNAWASDIAKVIVPFRNGGYTIHNSLLLRSGVTLETSKTTRFTLADAINLPMIININHTTGVTHYDSDICIDGGIWDGNRSGQDKYNFNYGSEIVLGFALVGVDRVTIKNATIMNTRTYGILFSNCNDIEFANSVVKVGVTNTPDNADGIHVLGPANNVNIHDCTIKSEDNCIAINANDVDHGERFTSIGIINNVDIRDIFLDNSKGQGILLLSTSHALNKVSIHSIKGVTGYFLNVSNFGLSSGSGSYSDINVYDIEVTIDGVQEDCIRIAGDINNISFRDIFMRTNWDGVWQRKFLRLYTINSNTCNVQDITLDNINVNCKTITSKPFYLIIQEGGIIENIHINRFVSIQNGCPIYFVKCSGKMTRLTISNCFLNNLYNGVLWIDSTGSVDYMTIDNIRFYDLVSSPRVCNPSNKVISIANISNMIDFEVKSVMFTMPRQNDLNWNDLIWYKNGEHIMYSGIVSKCQQSGSLFKRELTPNTNVLVGEKYTNQGNIIVCVLAGITGEDVSSISTTETKNITTGTAVFRMYHKGEAVFVDYVL